MSTILVGFNPERFSKSYREQIQEITPDMRLLVTKDREEMKAVLDDIEIAACQFPHGLLLRARNLRWYQQWGAGADWLLRHPGAAESDFVLTSTSGMHETQATEHIFAFLLAFARELHRAIRLQGRREWLSQGQHPGLFELSGKTMVLIGAGAIGEQTERVAVAFGMRILGVRRNPAIGLPGVEGMYGPDLLLDVLPQADVVVVTAPLTHETQGMIVEEELRAMKPTAYLVNIGRGGIVDESALVCALDEGWIAGAGLDVFEEEPLPKDSPLFGLENVIVTAHYAGVTPNYDERAMAIFLDNLRRYKAGEPLRNVVDKKLGY